MSGRPPRPAWTARCAPATVVAILIVAASGYLLAGVITARAGGPRLWARRGGQDALARHTWDAVATQAIAAALVLIGVLLIAAATTRGRAGLRAVRPADERAGADMGTNDGPAVGVFVTRRALNGLLGEHARSVPGVAAASARLRGHVVRVRAEQEFGSGPGVRPALERALRERMDTLGLDRTPSLHLRLLARERS